MHLRPPVQVNISKSNEIKSHVKSLNGGNQAVPSLLTSPLKKQNIVATSNPFKTNKKHEHYKHLLSFFLLLSSFFRLLVIYTSHSDHHTILKCGNIDKSDQSGLP